MSFCRHGFALESTSGISARCNLLDDFVQCMQQDNEQVQSQVGLKPERPFVGDNHKHRWKLHCVTMAKFVLYAAGAHKASLDSEMVSLCWSLATNCLIKGQLSSAYCIAELGILVQAYTNCPSNVDFAHLLMEHYHPPGTLQTILGGKKEGHAQHDDNGGNVADSYDIVRHYQKPLQNLGRNVEIYIAGKIPCSCLEDYRTPNPVNDVDTSVQNEKSATGEEMTGGSTVSSPTVATVNPNTIPMALKEQSFSKKSMSSPVRKARPKIGEVRRDGKDDVQNTSDASKNTPSKVEEDTDKQSTSEKQSLHKKSQQQGRQVDSAKTTPDEQQVSPPKDTASKTPVTPSAASSYKYKSRSYEIKKRAIAAKRATMLGTAKMLPSSPTAQYASDNSKKGSSSVTPSSPVTSSLIKLPPPTSRQAKPIMLPVISSNGPKDGRHQKSTTTTSMTITTPSHSTSRTNARQNNASDLNHSATSQGIRAAQTSAARVRISNNAPSGGVALVSPSRNRRSSIKITRVSLDGRVHREEK